MTIALRGTPKVGNDPAGGNVTLTFDVGAGAPQPGDVVIVWGGCGASRAGTGISTEGYQQLALNESGLARGGVWYKVMGPTPDLSVTGTGTGNSADGIAYACYVLSGVDPDVIDQTTVVVGPTSSTNPNCGTIVTQTNGAWVLALMLSAYIDTSFTDPSGYSNAIHDHGNGSGVDVTVAGATFEKEAAGSEDPPSWTLYSSSTWVAFTVALMPTRPSSSVKLVASGNWQSITEMDISVGGQMNDVQEGLIAIGGQWRQFWPPPQ